MERKLDTKSNMAKRSISQNNALHLLFEWTAEQVNETNLTLRDLVVDVDVPVNATTIKEFWRAIQLEQTGKKSTKDLEQGEVDKVFETFNRHLAKHGIELTFPSHEKRSEFFEAMDMRGELDYPVSEGELAF